MHAMIRRTVVALAVMVSLAGSAAMAFAQDTLMAEIPFSFTLKGRMYQAGKYDLNVKSDDMVIELNGPAKNSGVAPVLTRLSAPDTQATEGRLVFDKTNNTYHLSEVWFPGQDGYLLSAMKGKHTHHTIRAHRGTKSHT